MRRVPDAEKVRVGAALEPDREIELDGGLVHRRIVGLGTVRKQWPNETPAGESFDTDSTPILGSDPIGWLVRTGKPRRFGAGTRMKDGLARACAYRRAV